MSFWSLYHKQDNFILLIVVAMDDTKRY